MITLAPFHDWIKRYATNPEYLGYSIVTGKKKLEYDE